MRLELEESVLETQPNVGTVEVLSRVLRHIPEGGILTEEVGGRLTLLDKLTAAQASDEKTPKEVEFTREELYFLLAAYRTARWTLLDSGITRIFTKLVDMYNNQR